MEILVVLIGNNVISTGDCTIYGPFKNESECEIFVEKYRKNIGWGWNGDYQISTLTDPNEEI